MQGTVEYLNGVFSSDLEIEIQTEVDVLNVGGPGRNGHVVELSVSVYDASISQNPFGFGGGTWLTQDLDVITRAGREIGQTSGLQEIGRWSRICHFEAKNGGFA